MLSLIRRNKSLSMIYKGDLVAFVNGEAVWYIGRVIEVDVTAQWALIEYISPPGRFTGESHRQTVWLTGRSVVKLQVFSTWGIAAANADTIKQI